MSVYIFHVETIESDSIKCYIGSVHQKLS